MAFGMILPATHLALLLSGGAFLTGYASPLEAILVFVTTISGGIVTAALVVAMRHATADLRAKARFNRHQQHLLAKRGLI